MESAAGSGYTSVRADELYSPARGFGYEPSSGGAAEASRHFTVRVPQEGNYRVRVTLGHPTSDAATTIKAELRRLMVENVRTAAGKTAVVEFVVNTRTPIIAPVDGIAAGQVRLKAPRETVQEAWAWDDALTLELHPATAVAAVELQPVDVPTIFLLGDSTVCDQSKEPYNSWGQMLTRWFKPTVAIANHGESGETYRDSLARRRLDKLLSVMKPGDWLLMQFGHNDQKQIAAGTGGPFTTYQDEIKQHVERVRARGGHVVILSPMERRNFDEHGKVRPTLADYAKAARESAQQLGVPFLDLNAMSIPLYEALGPDRSTRAFAAPGGKVDNTHHNNYGSYQLSKCVVQALRELELPIARHLRDDFTPFNPSRPDDPDTFAVPASADFTNQRPLGD